MINPEFIDSELEDTLEHEADLIQDVRDKWQRGELFQERSYPPLEVNPDKAYEEVQRREEVIIKNARTILGGRYG